MRSVVQIRVCSMECDITLVVVVVVGVTADQRAGVCVPSSRIIPTIIITTHQPTTPTQPRPSQGSVTYKQSVAVTSAFVFEASLVK